MMKTRNTTSTRTRKPTRISQIEGQLDNMASGLQQSYDRVAQEYARRIYGELANKPFDRKMLDWLVEKVNRTGPICDMGCGPGQIARYLAEHGAQASGIDLSPGMIEEARRLNPDIPFQVGDMRALTGVA